MKRILAIVMVLALALSLTACAKTEKAESSAVEESSVAEESVAVEESAEEVSEEAAEESSETAEETSEVAVMSHLDYVNAELDSLVCVETYVQAKQGWWEDKATVYCQSEDGAYFLYNMPCSEADYERLVPGTRIKVTGYKAEWSGEVEIVDATFEIFDEGTFVAEPLDVTELLGKDELVDHQNELVAFKDLEVVASTDADGNEAAFLYNWDGSGEEGSDLYFNVKSGDVTAQFTVESYLCGADTDVYKAVKELKIGDKIDCEGFLYWYNGANPHITNVTVK
ncbi:MAG: hypothetical protein Q4C42_08200 [Clostridia bacterium]|nr:hypothetical protein [Clostridia bacterium]